MQMENRERVVFIDYIRMIAPLMVMLVHSSECFYAVSGIDGNFTRVDNDANRFWVPFYDGFLSRSCVPLFMMVSAYLLVPMKQGMTMTKFYGHRFMRILPPFICFLFLYSLLPVLWGGMSWNDCIESLKTIPLNFVPMGGHLWFMYPLISLYIIIPVVSPWLERSTAKEERLFLAFFVLSTFYPYLHMTVSEELWGECFWNEFHALWYCSGFLGYLVLAHYVRFHIHWSSSKRLRIGLLSFLVGSLFTGLSFWLVAVPGKLVETPVMEWGWRFCSPNVLLSTFGLFLMFSSITRKSAPKIVTELSKLSFGMYLMHMFFLSAMAEWIIGGNVASPRIPVYVAIPCIAVLTYLCSAVTAKLISYIPGSKYIIG